MSGERRSVLAPDSPSFGELGLKNLDIDLYFWMAGPAGLPRDIVDKWNKELASMLALPDVRETFMKQGMVPRTAVPRRSRSRSPPTSRAWKKFIAETGIKAD